MKRTCNSCQSNKIVDDIPVADNGYLQRFNLAIHIDRNPNALIYKNPNIYELKAGVCIDCGSVELYLPNPESFYKDYLKQKK